MEELPAGENYITPGVYYHCGYLSGQISENLAQLNLTHSITLLRSGQGGVLITGSPQSDFQVNTV